jgi:hypothetical protein
LVVFKGGTVEYRTVAPVAAASSSSFINAYTTQQIFSSIFHGGLLPSLL